MSLLLQVEVLQAMAKEQDLRAVAAATALANMEALKQRIAGLQVTPPLYVRSELA